MGKIIFTEQQICVSPEIRIYKVAVLVLFVLLSLGYFCFEHFIILGWVQRTFPSLSSCSIGGKAT